MENWKYDESNAEFWDYLCGMNSVLTLGFDVSTREGIDHFDDWYFDFYPYLKVYLEEVLVGKESVLEIGLGLGTVSRYLSERVERYVGLDVAANVVNFNNSEFVRRGLNGKCIHGSILDPKIDEKFDLVIAIGSLHHTGDFNKALKNAFSLMSEEGQLLIMIYNEFSLFNWIHFPKKTFRAYLDFRLSGIKQWDEVFAEIRAVNDSNLQGVAAPSTSYFHKNVFKDYGEIFNQNWKIQIRNTNNLRVFRNIFINRNLILNNLARICGTDIYAISSSKANRIK